jgi:hypothetical protein
MCDSKNTLPSSAAEIIEIAKAIRAEINKDEADNIKPNDFDLVFKAAVQAAIERSMNL